MKNDKIEWSDLTWYMQTGIIGGLIYISLAIIYGIVGAITGG